MKNPGEIWLGGIAFSPHTRDLRDQAGNRIELRNKSSEVLAYLAERPGMIVAKSDIMEAIWPDVTVSDESLTQCIADIRRALGDKDQDLLQTHIGKGYSLNIADDAPVQRTRAPAWAAVGLVILAMAALAIWLLSAEREPDGPTRIAVLAFEDLSPGDDQGHLGDGIAEGIITELARYPELAVIARNSSFSFRDSATDVVEIAEKLRADFVVEGSMQKSGDRLKVTVQLINARDSTHHWAHEFETDLDDYFDVQSRIVLGVATHLGRELAWLQPATGGQEKVSALHLYLRGNTEFSRQTPQSFRAARDLYQAAIEADPDAPYGYVGMSLIVYKEIPNPLLFKDMPRDELLEMGVDFAEKALYLEPDYYAAHIARGDMHDRAGEHEMAIVRYQQAAKLNPSSADAMALASEPLLFLGREDEAIVVLDRAFNINPIAPGWYYKSMSFAYWAAGKCNEAIGWIKKRSRFHPWDLRHMMVAQACAGDLDGARETAARHLELEPEYTVRTYRERNTVSFKKNPELLERFLADLGKAGMPQG